jgi:NAD(P)-dependent dehydrogenase (short-subunit alcohol dehydrogenase family)
MQPFGRRRGSTNIAAATDHSVGKLGCSNAGKKCQSSSVAENEFVYRRNFDRLRQSEFRHQSTEVESAMNRPMDRRQFVQAGSGLLFGSLLPHCLWAGFEDIPRSSFGADTTAEEVLAGLDLTGKTVLITGANSGLGYESMRTMAARGAWVIGTARTTEKAQTACDSVAGKTTPMVCELTDFESIVQCSDAVAELDVPIDVLMCNAGIMALPELEQVNGIEKQFFVNHLGHYLLTRRLLTQVEAADAGRVVMVSSIGYRNAPKEGIQFDNLSGENGYKAFTAYGQSKLANALFSLELARRYQGTSLTSNAIHPGVVRTNLARYFRKEPMDPDAPLRPGMKTVDKGAATQVYVGASPNLNGVSGYWFEDCNPVTPDGPHMQDYELAGRLWDVSEELTAAYI